MGRGQERRPLLLGTGAMDEARASVTLDQDTAWWLFTNDITRDEARRQATVGGDPVLAGRVLATVSILA